MDNKNIPLTPLSANEAKCENELANLNVIDKGV